MTKALVSRVFFLSLLLSLLTVQSWSVETPSDPLSPVEQIPAEPMTVPGIQLGALSLLPELAVSATYDDNIFATRTENLSDHILHLLPSIDIHSRWTEHSLNLNLGADIARYEQYASEDFEDYWLSASGRYDMNKSFNLFGGTGYNREHEDRGSPENQNGEEPTIFYSHTAHLGGEIKDGRIKIRLGGTYEELDFDDVGTSTGFHINNDDRDRKLIGAGVQVSYDLSDTIHPFAQYIYDDREYDILMDDNGYRRDSNGYRLAAGLKYLTRPTLSAEFYAGTLYQDYEDNRFSDVSKPDFGTKITWLPSATARISGVIERTLEETTMSRSPGYLETSYSLKFGYNLNRKTTFRSHLQFSEDDYQGVSRKDQNIMAGLGLQYDLSQNLFLGVDYNFNHRSSNIDESNNPDGNDYYRHQFMVSLGARLYPVKVDPLEGFDKALSELEIVDAPPQGFYLGGLFSHGAMVTKTNEERLHGGSSKADFGASGLSGGIFGGYNIPLERWIFSLELEAEESSLEWAHVKNKTESRTFSVKQNKGLGASLRLGYTMLDGSILYGRAGVIKTQFDTFYAINEFPQEVYSDTEMMTGLRFGIGLDIPLSRQWFWRMETTYTNYESYNVASSLFNESFAPEEHVFNLGIGWRFDAPENTPTDLIVEDLSGPYAGVMVGFGTLASDVRGIHNDGGGSDPGPKQYQSDFAGRDVTSGLFFGYGKMVDRIYIGAELEAEVNAMEWFRERQTNGGGRNFSVEVKEGYGANARLGYQYRNGTLAYLKGGIVKSKVITRYAKGGNRANDIYHDEFLDGVRFGIGAEVPISQRVFARLEYLYTEYDKYQLVTDHDKSDQLNFEHSQEMVRLGIVFRF